MESNEVFDKLERKKLLSCNQRACVQVLRSVVNEEEVREIASSKGIPVRVELGMLVVG